MLSSAERSWKFVQRDIHTENAFRLVAMCAINDSVTEVVVLMINPKLRRNY